jgi:error-prone DNA polymerase
MSVRYAELRCKTNFTFLEGASHAEELVTRAAELGHAALAVTDTNSLAGIVRAHVAAKKVGLKLLVGAEITPTDAPAVLLYAPDLPAYGRLSTLITRGRRNAPKGECRLTFADVAEHADGLLAAVVPERPLARAACPDGLSRYRDVFAGRCYLMAGLHHGPNDEADLRRLVRLAGRARLPLVAGNDVHYHDPGRRPLQDVLTAVRHGVTVAELGALRYPNAERHLKSPAEMAALFAGHTQALAHGLELADRCRFSLDELRYSYPEELCPPGLTPTRYLDELTWIGARRRYGGRVPGKVAELIRHELALIEELRYESYFLTVWDLVRFARSRGILCQGRGSAANSAVCYCLGVTAVDPERTELLFERFISRERNEPPDIDIDFEHERREEVLQYVYEKYGRDRAGIVAEVITYRPRSAVRDVAKALGMSQDRVDSVAKALDHYGSAGELAARLKEAGLDPRAPGVAHLMTLVTELLGFPRHLSQHVGGFVITRGPLAELVPIANAAMPGRTMIEWDKDDIDAVGLLKVDCLSLGMLTAIRKCLDLLRSPPFSRERSASAELSSARGTLAAKPEAEGQQHDASQSLAAIPAEDPKVYDMICRADTVGVFQIESRAQMSMLPRLKPKKFYDLVVEIAIVRPGPIQGGMIHPYLRRRNLEEPVTYPNAEVRAVLCKTLGVPLFQEQVMRLAMVAAGFTPGEADELRRAMGSWRRTGVIDRFRTRLRDGMRARGISDEYAAVIYEQIRGFGEYGFPESHSASFALLAYASAWLKCYHPAAFTASLLNSQPMGFYAPAQLVRDAHEHGVTVLPVDVNRSEWDCTLEVRSQGSGVRGQESGVGRETLDPRAPSPELRLGFRLVGGLPRSAADGLVEARGSGPFPSVSDLARRTRMGRPLLARLAAADAFHSVGLGRRAALWHVLSAGEELPLFAGVEDEPPPPPLPEMLLNEEVAADYEHTGLSLKAHPIGLLRGALNALLAVPASTLAKLSDRSNVRVAGLVTARQRPPTAKGVVFMTLEDETGVINLVVRPTVWERYRHTRSAVALLATGGVESAEGVVYVSPARLDDLSTLLGGIDSQSRDFH